MRYALLLVALLFACGGKHSNAPSVPEHQSNNDRDSVPDGGADAGVDGGTDGGLDGGTDGGLGGGLSGYTATLNLTRRPQDADPPGFWAVQVDFAPPLPVGLRLSLKWTTNDCETGCVSYTVGSAPPLCWGP